MAPVNTPPTIFNKTIDIPTSFVGNPDYTDNGDGTLTVR